jgi:3-hydroxyisobutyrate dehydrogenase-like beta-hydroxyacid dehydrogenase
MKKIAFLGLGIMGFPMARHLIQKGFKVSVWNRNFAKAKKFMEEFGGLASEKIENIVKDADYVITCLGNDASVESISSEFLPFMKKGACFIDHTTISANLTRKLFEKCKSFEVDFLEAPVTGGQAGAENGKLTILCGGERGVFEKSLEVLQIYGVKIEYFGEAGMGQSAKMVNQIAIAGIIQSLAEAINFAEKAGLETEKLMKTLSIGAGSSWQMNSRHELMISGDYKENFGFPVEWMVKDLEIAIEEASKINADLKITAEVNSLFKKVRDEISPRFDTSSLILLLKKA